MRGARVGEARVGEASEGVGGAVVRFFRISAQRIFRPVVFSPLASVITQKRPCKVT